MNREDELELKRVKEDAAYESFKTILSMDNGYLKLGKIIEFGITNNLKDRCKDLKVSKMPLVSAIGCSCKDTETSTIECKFPQDMKSKTIVKDLEKLMKKCIDKIVKKRKSIFRKVGQVIVYSDPFVTIAPDKKSFFVTEELVNKKIQYVNKESK